jgi:hypothetical protein
MGSTVRPCATLAVEQEKVQSSIILMPMDYGTQQVNKASV